MKALYDQNLPPSLVARLSDILPNSEHVRNLGMASADDADIWDYASTHGFTIFSKDSDFQSLAMLKGHPPKSVRLGIGNANVTDVANFIRTHIRRVLQFGSDPNESHLDLR